MKKYLQEVYDLLKTGWIQGMYAGKKYGPNPRTDYESKYIKEESADCFCSVGACMRVADKYNIPVGELLGPVNACLPDGFRQYNVPLDRIISFNDGINTKHEDVLNVFQCAISQAPETV